MSVKLKLQIRLAQDKDIRSLSQLSSYKNLIELPQDEEILVAEENGLILGAVSARRKKILYVPSAGKLRFFRIRKVETNAWVHRLDVREDQRSKGLGGELLKSMVTHLRTKGTKTLYAGIAPTPFKEISRKVFLKAGFADLGSCICMRKVMHMLCVGNLMIAHL